MFKLPNPTGLFKHDRAPLCLALALCAATALSVAPPAPAFPLDDSYIHLAYGKNILASGDFGLNPGETSYGASSILWPFILAGLQMAPPRALFALSALVSFVSLAVLIILLFDGLQSRRSRWFAALLLGMAGFNAWHVYSGMETLFFSAMCAAAINSVTRRRPALLSWLLLSLCLLIRINACLLVGVLAGTAILKAQGNVKAIARILVYHASTLLPYLGIVTALGLPLSPTTATGKLLTYVNVMGVIGYNWFLLTSLARYLPLVTILAVVVPLYGSFLLLRDRQSALKPALDNAVVLFSFWALLDALSYSILFRSFVLQQFRYYTPWIVAVLASGAVVLDCLLPRNSRSLGILTAIILLVSQVSASSLWRKILAGNVKHMLEVHIAAAHYVHEVLRPQRIGSFDVGALAFFAPPGIRIVDLGGLTDPRAHPYLVHHQVAGYLFKNDVDVIAVPKQPYSDFCTGLYLTEYAPSYRTPLRVVRSFSTAPYPHPEVTQSLQIDVIDLSMRRVTCDEECRADIFERAARDNLALRPVGATLDDWRLESVALQPRNLLRFKGIPTPEVMDVYLRWRPSSSYAAAHPVSRLCTFQARHPDGHPVYTAHFSIRPFNHDLRIARSGVLYQEHHILPVEDKLPVGEYDIVLSCAESDPILLDRVRVLDATREYQ